MNRSNDPVISVKIPVRWSAMTKKQKTRLSRITSRDTRVIKAFLGVIERHESELLVGKRRNRIDSRKLTNLTLTATRGKTNRTQVQHDFKKRFPNISVNELQECRNTALAMWNSYLSLGGGKPLQSSSRILKKIPRFIFDNRFELIYTPESEIKHWLRLRDSLDSARQSRRVHDQLLIPLSPSSYHLTRLKSGEAKSIRTLKDRTGKWWIVFSVRLITPLQESPLRQPAVMGIDLGVRKAVCSVLLTKTGSKQVLYWTQKDKVKQMQHYDSMVTSINSGIDASAVNKRLREISGKRQNVSVDHDRKLVSMLVSHILEMSQQYDLYIAIGRVRGIRNAARRGNRKGRRFRGMIHRWSFYRITEALKHKLTMSGFDEKRVFSVSESWTSIKCHKCGHTGLRPKQSYFLCHTCGYRDNADKNGAINIGRRLIMLIPSLQDEKNGLGMWLHPKDKATLKARRKSISKGKSILPEKTPASFEGKSVVDCHDQETLENLVSSTGPAMATTVETPSVVKRTGTFDTSRQGTDAQFQERSNAPMALNKGHVTVDGASRLLIGDNSHDKGGTQKSEVKEASSIYNVSNTSEGIRSGSQVIGFPRIILEDVVEQVGSRNKVSNLTKTGRNINQSPKMNVSSTPERLLDQSVGSNVADYHDQTSLEEFVSSTDLAMEKTMEKPSAIMESSGHDSDVQRNETASVERSHAPMTHSKTRAHSTGEVLLVAGDSSHEEV